MRANIIRDRLEVGQDLLRILDDLLVLQHGFVVRDVDCRGLRGELGVDALGIGVTLAEGLESRDSLCYMI